MKKLCFLMALIICLGCALLAACSNHEAETTDTDTSVETTTEAPDPSDDTSDPGAETTERGPIDDSKDAYADDIYEGVAPEIYG